MRAIAVILIIYLVFYGFAILGQRSLLYLPDKKKPDPAHSAIPGIETIDVVTADGLVLQSWYQAPASESMPTILLFHGNGGHHGWRTHTMRPLAERGYGVLLASYRGYGGNPGKPSEDGLYADARAHIDWLTMKAGTPLRNIVLYGESLGTGPAIQIAREYDAGALILQAPYDSIAGVAQIHFFYFPLLRYFVWDKFDNVSKIGALTLPTLILLAENDRVIPARSGKRLAAAANEAAKVVTLKKAGHNSMHANGANTAILEFLETYEMAR